MPGKTNPEQEIAEDYDRPVQFIDWNGSRVKLTENDLTGETKLWIEAGESYVQIETNYFVESDVDYSNLKLHFNKLAVYKDRLYAGCDDGLVAVITTCSKCFKLKKVCDFDIKAMSIYDGIMTVDDGDEETVDVNMTDIGGDSIEADEANQLKLSGGVFVDVREAVDFAEKSVEGSVNIPLADLEEGLAAYEKDTTLIFYCYSGMRASQAVKIASELGYTNVYTLGSIDKLL